MISRLTLGGIDDEFGLGHGREGRFGRRKGKGFFIIGQTISTLLDCLTKGQIFS
jgi:hypothetical protein